MMQNVPPSLSHEWLQFFIEMLSRILFDIFSRWDSVFRSILISLIRFLQLTSRDGTDVNERLKMAQEAALHTYARFNPFCSTYFLRFAQKAESSVDR